MMYRFPLLVDNRLTSGAQLSDPVVQEPLLGRASWLMTDHGPSGAFATATWIW